ncbi:LysE/ArgO family amino acid transporter [Halopseudomonas pelagia]|uniref:LysE/ArgO family amino acid transporter n=1 Tax=Halopseudomonas pelagia TaxID=553151 RepID=UPI0003A2DFAE|nr:LysE/ArgO family amino acid transporter [Halopseudomonas pelagia]|tara:strand:+ start:166 stop:762 length:597 start_codon:yes stop_codon:yes gene_type:complete
MFNTYFTGLFIATSLIMAIGAQNAFVLGQSLKREYHLSAALLCMICDAVLIAAGTFGLGRLLQEHSLALDITRWGGVLFLLGYACLALRRASRPTTLSTQPTAARSRTAVIMTTLAVTLLNPHVYLDTVVLIGAVGAQQEQPALFALGAASGSILWFSALALGGAWLAPWLNRPHTWRVIDIVVAGMMLSVAWDLASA